MDDRTGRMAKTIEEAKKFLFFFIYENKLRSENPLVSVRSHDYDLFLPWMFEVIENQNVEESDEAPEVLAIDELYMEAAWQLVMDGYLRPGPRRSTGESSGQGYGKGFSLTLKGKQYVKDEIQSRVTTKEAGPSPTA